MSTKARSVSLKMVVSSLVAFFAISSGIIAMLQFVGIAHLQDITNLQDHPQSSASTPTPPPTGAVSPIPFFYSSAVLGPSCADGDEVWTLVNASAICTNTGTMLTLSDPAGLGELQFRPLSPLPAQYSVSVDIGGLSSSNCAGVLTHGSDARTSAYTFTVCGDGRWFVDELDQHKQFLLTTDGNISAKPNFSIKVVCTDKSQVLSINGQQLAHLANNSLLPTDFVSIFVDPATNGTGVATFSNFVVAEIT